MMRRVLICAGALAVLGALLSAPRARQVEAASHPDPQKAFRTADRCVACHNGLKASSGQDISIGFAWRASIMANSARDPYWQGSVRRETLDHPESSAAIQDECSTCHMPMQHLIDKMQAHETAVLARLPLNAPHKRLDTQSAADGVSCSVCHQIEAAGLGSRDSFNGNVAVAPAARSTGRPEYGPFVIDTGHQQVMESSTAGMTPTQAAHIRDSALCGSCHTLYTVARGAGGKAIGQLPEQMPYLEWLHSSYRTTRSCQDCHMPAVPEPVAITALYGPPRTDMHQHTFLGGNFLMEQLLASHRGDLAVVALPAELAAARASTIAFLQTQSARLSLSAAEPTGGAGLRFTVHVENLTGHKLPTAYPSRRAWLHVTVSDRSGAVLFESGALRPDGSIAGNPNDADPTRFAPHYSEINMPDQVEIFESILKDASGRVTTGLIAATGYLKDNRILPAGFDKQTAEPDIAVTGEAAADPRFAAGSAETTYDIATRGATGPFRIAVELMYQPIGFRWAHNLAPYDAAEPQRFVRYYTESAAGSAVVLARAETTLTTAPGAAR